MLFLIFTYLSFPLLKASTTTTATPIEEDDEMATVDWGLIWQAILSAAQASTTTAAMVTIPSLPFFSSFPLKVGAPPTSVVTFPPLSDLLPPPHSSSSLTATAGVIHTTSFLPSVTLG